jgi:hypothetical protein
VKALERSPQKTRPHKWYEPERESFSPKKIGQSPVNHWLLQEKLRILSKNSKLVSRGMAEIVRSKKVGQSEKT